MYDLTQEISNAFMESNLPSGVILHDTKTVVVIRDKAHQTLYSNAGFDRSFDVDRENSVKSTGKPAICIEKIRINDRNTPCLTIYFPLRNNDEIVGVGIVGIPVAGFPHRKPDTGRPVRKNVDKIPIAGILNPSFMLASLEKEIHREKHNRVSTTVVLMSIDKFAKMNEVWGKFTIKTVLHEFCELIKSQLRSSDLFGKWGEKEFILLLPETGFKTGNRIAERIRIAIEQRQFSSVGQISASFGIATHRAGETVEDYIKRIDAAVFTAKTSGKNRLELKAGHFLKLVWKQEYECGHDVIDDQHRKLFSHANELLYAVFDNQPRKRISPLIHQLLDHIRRHFDEEERILASLGYEQTEEHARIHRQLVEKGIRLTGRFEKNELDFDEIFSFLANEIVIEHMQKEDRKFFCFLSKLHN